MNSFKIGKSYIGLDNPTYVVAEIGANHNGSLNIAKESIDAAMDCGVDAVKFQTYTAKELLADYDRVITWGKNNTQEIISEMFNRISLKREWHEEVFNYARKKGVEVFSTPFSVDGVRFLDKFNVPCFKIAASDLNFVDMLIEVAKTNKPIMLSLGKCTLAEVDMSVNLLEDNNVNELVLMHCVAQYPSPINEMNISVIKSLKEIYPEYVIGFSDHSLGITAALGAVAYGAKVIEKHFTIDKNLDGPDHWFSMDPIEMKSLVTEIRNLEQSIGSPRKRVLSCEEDERKKSIRSLVLSKDIKKGEIISRNHIKMVRPGYGISPFDIEKVIGLRVTKDLCENTVLKWEFFK